MRKVILMAGLTLGLGACATLPSSKPTPGDPFERFNRSMWKFDNAVDHAILRPVAGGYVRFTPHPVRQGIHNFVTNLTYSDTIVNDLLQAQLKDFGNDVARLVVNSVLGIGGLFDPATHFNLDRHDRDFGQTLGIWGLNRGPFIMLPFLGPSDVRDTFGRAADTYLEPYPYIPSQYQYESWGVYLIQKLDERAGLLDQDNLIDSAYDPYVFVRNAYLQEREFKVHGNKNETETPEQLFPGISDSDSGAGTGAGNAPKPGAPATPPSAPPPQR